MPKSAAATAKQPSSQPAKARSTTTRSTTTLWRISNYPDLKGIGGLHASGRWHNRGVAVVYLAEHPALAMLEVLVHFELTADEVPENYQLLSAQFPSGQIQTLDAAALGPDWQQNQELTRTIGDEWLSSASSLLLRVPSAITPFSNNYLFNPRHPNAQQAEISTVTEHPYDDRLIEVP